MLIGYARTSTVEHVAGFEAQLAVLAEQGCTQVFQEQVSSVPSVGNLRQQSTGAATVVVTKLDRLARSVIHLNELVERLESKKV